MAMGLGLTNGFVYPDNYTNIEADGLFTGMIKSFNTTVVDFFSEVFCCKKNMNKVFTLRSGTFYMVSGKGEFHYRRTLCGSALYP